MVVLIWFGVPVAVSHIAQAGLKLVVLLTGLELPDLPAFTQEL